MKTRTYLLIAIAAYALALGSCSQDGGRDEASISLNEGKKWEVHDNMMVHIEQMATDISAMSTSAVMNYDDLNESLLSGIDSLTSDCTMKGRAHDELHKWLHPFMSTVNEYRPDMVDGQKRDWFNEVGESMNEFEQYFE